jgi:predicted dehydrogenase
MPTSEPSLNGLSRRHFLQTAAVVGSAAAFASPALLRAQDSGRKITLGFVGCAHIHTPSFVDLLKGRPDVRVKTVWDPQRVRSEKRARTLNAAVTDNVKDIWSDPEIQAVVICSETNRHLDLITQAAKAGKHMFAEKPLGITARDSWAMASAIEKAGLIFTTGYFMRTSPQHIFLKEQIAAGKLGIVTRARGSNCHSGSLGGWFDDNPKDPADSWRWMADPKVAGVGAFGDLGTHSLDILMWLLGDVERVSADIRVVTGRYGPCDETGEALLRFRNGTIATLAAGWVDVADPITLLVSGTKGHAHIANGKLFYKSSDVEGADGNQPWTKLPEAPRAPMHQFVDAVAGKTGLPLVTPREAAARVSVMEAAYKSARTHNAVKPS